MINAVVEGRLHKLRSVLGKLRSSFLGESRGRLEPGCCIVQDCWKTETRVRPSRTLEECMKQAAEACPAQVIHVYPPEQGFEPLQIRLCFLPGKTTGP